MNHSATIRDYHTIRGEQPSNQNTIVAEQQPIIAAAGPPQTTAELTNVTRQYASMPLGSMQPRRQRQIRRKVSPGNASLVPSPLSTSARTTLRSNISASVHSADEALREPIEGRSGSKQITAKKSRAVSAEPKARASTTFPFEATELKAPVFDGEGNVVRFTVSAKMKVRGQWHDEGGRRVIYRRNYITIEDAHYTIQAAARSSDRALYIMAGDHGEHRPISSLLLGISAWVVEDRRYTALEQFPTAKRTDPHIPQTKALRPFGQRSIGDEAEEVHSAAVHRFPLSTGEIAGTTSTTHTWPRVQFRHGTKNNGVRRQNQGCYRLVVSLQAKSRNSDGAEQYCTTIAECATPELIVFARSPRGVKGNRPEESVSGRTGKAQGRTATASQSRGPRLAPRLGEDDDDAFDVESASGKGATTMIPGAGALRRSNRLRYVPGSLSEDKAESPGMVEDDIAAIAALRAPTEQESGSHITVAAEIIEGPRAEVTGTVVSQTGDNEDVWQESSPINEGYEGSMLDPSLFEGTLSAELAPTDEFFGDWMDAGEHRDQPDPAYSGLPRFQDAAAETFGMGGWHAPQDIQTGGHNLQEKSRGPPDAVGPVDVLSNIKPPTGSVDMRDVEARSLAEEGRTTVYDRVHDNDSPSFVPAHVIEASPKDEPSWPSEFEELLEMRDHDTLVTSVESASSPFLDYERDFAQFLGHMR
ncbi:MAG: hypothetical protein Q9163_002227 [Psora crenata]